jgi:hypothetical protein
VDRENYIKFQQQYLNDIFSLTDDEGEAQACFTAGCMVTEMMAVATMGGADG